MTRTDNRVRPKKKRVKVPLKSKALVPISDTLTAKLQSLVNIKDIAEHGFSRDVWVSLSFEEKQNLPAFISSKFRHSDGTKADKMRNDETKRIIHKQIMKYEKFARRMFYSGNTKKIKTVKAKDGTLTCSKAADVLWNELDDAGKNKWYNDHTAPDVSKEQKA